MKYLSVCSGIEAATVAWHPLGWRPWAFAEIDAFPSAVLAHHYPTTPNLGDMTKFKDWPDAAIDVLVGGTPCQSFSVAGLRNGLADPRGNLMLTYCAIAAKYRPSWLVWENVPGVLSSNFGRDFGALLGAMAELGYGFAYRVLDAQYFGVAQRRRRVFVVGCLGDWRRAAAVLFERDSLSGNPAPRREAREVAPTIPSRRSGGGGFGTDFDRAGGLIAGTLRGTDGGIDVDHARALHVVAQPLLAGGHTNNPLDTTLVCIAHGQGGAEISTNGGAPTLTCNHEAPIVAFDCKASGKTGHAIGEVAGALRGEGFGGGHAAIAFQGQGTNISVGDIAGTLRTNGDRASGSGACVQQSMQVRRLTPRECERLQGFPDDYTLIPLRRQVRKQRKNEPDAIYADYLAKLPMAKDGPRYKALGNSMAVPVMRRIGERIQAVEAIAP